MSSLYAGRNRICFTLIGLANNFGYVVMLTAAHDLISIISGNDEDTKYCNDLSTSTILLADTLPSLTIKIIYPILLLHVETKYKVIATIVFSLLSFFITGITLYSAVIFTGVALGSLAAGCGEPTFLSIMPKYGDPAFGGWSIGTGLAGFLGSLSYLFLKSLSMSSQNIMFVLLVVPFIMALAYYSAKVPSNNVSPKPPDETTSLNVSRQNSQILASSSRALTLESHVDPENNQLTLLEKWKALPLLIGYFFPLVLVYFGEYFINLGLFELVYYDDITYFDKKAQYRFFSTAYQFSVLISRSSIELFKIPYCWTMGYLQIANLVIFLLHTTKIIHIPNFYLMTALVLYEGLLGGFAYVNTFYRITREIEPKYRQFAMSTASLGDSIGIVVAGLISIPVHNSICKLYTEVTVR